MDDHKFLQESTSNLTNLTRSGVPQLLLSIKATEGHCSLFDF